MFTGIIETAGEVVSLGEAGQGGRLTISAPEIAGELETGESVAVNGCCLTVTEAGDGVAGFDLLAETLRVTNLGDTRPGSRVNLERAVRAGDRMSGHFVQGHVDCVSEVRAFAPEGQDHRLEVALPGEFARYVVYKGSIAIDGISLTVAKVTEAGSFEVWIIPHTCEVTNLKGVKAGDRVNLEFDVLAKYVLGDREG